MKQRKKMIARFIIASSLATSVRADRGTTMLNKMEQFDNKPTTYIQGKDGKYLKI